MPGLTTTRLTVLGLALSFCSTLFAQEELLPVYHFQTPEGFQPEWVTSRVVQDSVGFIWIGTQNGLRRYDGYDFREYRNVPDDPYSLSSSRIHSLLVDKEGRLWVGTMEKGVSLYDRLRDRFINFYPYPDDSSFGRRTIFSMKEDRAGNLWLATSPDGVVRVEIPAKTGSSDLDSVARFLHFRKIPLGTHWNTAYDLCERQDGKILVGSDSGLMVLDPATYSVTHPHLPGPLGRRIDTLNIMCLLQESNGNLWLGTGSEGLFGIDWARGTVVNYRHRKADSLSIGHDEILEMASDRCGNLWIGSTKGVDLFSPVTGRCMPYLTYGPGPQGNDFPRFSYDKSGAFWVATGFVPGRLSPRSRLFPQFSVRNQYGISSFQAIERSADGGLWCLSEGKLLQIDVTKRIILKRLDVFGKRRSYRQDPDRTSSLLDKKGDFWYAAWDLGLYRIDLATGSVKNYTYPASNGTPAVRNIAQGPGDSFWIGADYEGVMKFDPGSGTFVKADAGSVSSLMKDHEGKLWIATVDGLQVHDPSTEKTIRLVHVPSDPRSLSHNLTWSVYEDPLRRIWVGAGNVINLWDSSSRSFTRYANPGFPDAAEAHPVGSDNRGRLWIRHDKGLSILEPLDGSFSNFDNTEGVCTQVIDMEMLDGGKVVLAGWSGLNIVSPDSIDLRRPPPPLVITRMAINDEPVVPPPLVNGSGSLHLSYTQDVLEFQFAAIDLDAPRLVRYQYQLHGYEKNWVKLIDRRYVRYTALPPGDYVFKVRAGSLRGEWPDQEIALVVGISPPWWRTVWAYALYVSLFIGALLGAYRLRLRQVRLQQSVEMEHFQRERLAELDRQKSRFFANISHEFRTPLTLILGPLEKIRLKVQDEEIQQSLGMMKRNAHRLLRLINQLLDLSKLEAGAMKLRASCTNIVPLVKGIANSFESSAGMRGIALNMSVGEEEIEVYFDKDMMEKILGNLLSNAFKFTPKGGTVSVTLTRFRIQKSEVGIQNAVPGGWTAGVLISVSDTGTGIPPDQLDKIFDRFYQVDASLTREQEGSGIGLALVKELVDLHHGTIQVQSEVGHGTTFTVRLPLGRSHLRDEEIVEAPVAIEPVVPEPGGTGRSLEDVGEEARSAQARGEKPIILVVEDNTDVRTYIKDYLVPAYQVAEARDGSEGIEIARETVPDLVISDVMMPKKDGYELCRTLKTDERTSHVPIILLTAKAGSENKIEGLETGADDYLIKPFEPKELQARVGNLIELRRKLRERFRVSVPLRLGEVAVTSLDNAFLKRVMAAVEQHIGEEQFHVEGLAAEVGMSRVQLHRKLTALTNQSPGGFIRYLRLHRALALLQQGGRTVSEVAYAVGFSDPSYFSKCFHRQFGETPTEVRKPSGG